MQNTKKVLVVEDEFIVRLDVALELEDEGFDVIAAGTADEALQVLPAEAPVDVLFTDIDMPGKLDGLELAHQVREHYPDVDVIVTSGSTPDTTALPQNSVFVPKPYLMKSITTMIGVLSQQRSLRAKGGH